MPAEHSVAPEITQTPESAEPVTFAALGVPAELVEVLEEEGITTPFPVQAATLPDALAGRDILGRARTGSGKTLGFSLPMVSRLAGGSTLSARPRGLVLVPTRELASQVTAVLKPLARAMNLWVTTIYGGVSYGPQVNALQRRTDIVVATPGRLADLISQGECDLADVEVTVIDEADQMADLGFLPIVRRLLESTPDGGQRMLFSATLDAAIDVLARRFLTDPVLHSVDENSSPAEIEHHVITIEPTQKLAIVSALAGGEKRSLVFTRTKHGAERLARQLTEAGIPAAELHGNLRQNARSRNLAAFADGIARVMVATDIAARGIHIDGIDLVVHADPPAEHKAYVHRSGRTARGGADGVVVTLQLKSQARDVTAMMRKAGITPHDAVAADADSAVLTEIAGPPAPRVTVGGKVAELVRPEDRLAANDRPGVGKPWEGRPRRDRARGPHGDRVRKPRDDRFRSRPARDAGPREAGPRDDRPARFDGSNDRPARFERDDRPARFERDDRGPRFQRDDRGPRFQRDDRAPRSDRDDRPARFDRDDRAPRFRRDDRPARSDGNDRPARFDRDDRGPRFQRDDRPARSDGNDRPARFDRDDRGPRFQRDDRAPRSDRDDRGTRDRDFGGRDPGARGSGDRGFGTRPARGGQNSNDWYPRSGGRSAQSGGPRLGSYGQGGQRGQAGQGGQFGDRRQSRDGGSYRGGQNGDGGSYRNDRDDRQGDRSVRDDRPFRGEGSARPQGNDRPQAGGRPRSGGTDRPQSGGHFGGSSRRFGYSAGQRTASKRRDSGQGRHF